MKSLRRFFIRVFNFTSRREHDERLREEIEEHIALQTAENLRVGLSPVEARRQALLKFGSMEAIKEEYRAERRLPLIETLLQDLRFGLRLFRKSPGFTFVAVLTLALGIGANTAIFSLIDTVMLRLLPVQQPEQLVQLLKFNPARHRTDDGFTYALWENVRDRQDVFSDTLAWSEKRFDLSQGGAVHNANGIFASGSLFSTLGVAPALGRLIVPSDDYRGCPPVAVVSYGFWREHFGGAANAVGSRLFLNRHVFDVIGVSAPGFYGVEVGSKFDVAIPLCSAELFDGKKSRLDTRDSWWLSIVGRLKPGVTAEQLQARLKALSPQVFAAALPPDWGVDGSRNFLQRQLVSVPAATGISQMREQFGQPLVILFGVAGLVLLIASANLASLMLARGASRNKEIAVRKALGASRARLLRQLLTECLMLSCAGALLGILVARWGTALLVRQISTADNMVFLDLSPDIRILVFTACIAVATAVLFGILPALRFSGVPLVTAMKGKEAPETVHRTWFRVRSGSWIVASQVALSLVLLMVAGLFLRSLMNLVTLDLGFDRNNVLLMTAILKPTTVPPDKRLPVYQEIEARLRSLPGVVSVGSTQRTPVTRGGWSQPVEVDRAGATTENERDVWFQAVSPGYFDTLRTQFLAGRDFTWHDDRASGLVAIVNQSFVHEYFPNADPVGRSFRRIEGPVKPATTIQVVGVVKDSKYSSLHEAPFPQAFFPIAQVSDRDREADDVEIYAVRTAPPPSAMIAAAQNAVAGVNKSISLSFHSLAERVDDSIVQERLLAVLSGFFGGLALMLAMIGLYGTLAYLVSRRQGEFGLRMALGAPRRSILQLVMREMTMILLAGVLAGMTISLATVRLIQKFLFRLTPHDPVTLWCALALLTAVALIACYLPARRAMRVELMTSLRYE
jgi:putative ABC transport system permease protein